MRPLRLSFSKATNKPCETGLPPCSSFGRKPAKRTPGEGNRAAAPFQPREEYLKTLI